jgi:hypothetical protein
MYQEIEVICTYTVKRGEPAAGGDMAALRQETRLNCSKCAAKTTAVHNVSASSPYCLSRLANFVDKDPKKFPEQQKRGGSEIPSGDFPIHLLKHLPGGGTLLTVYTRSFFFFFGLLGE